MKPEPAKYDMTLAALFVGLGLSEMEPDNKRTNTTQVGFYEAEK